VSGQAMIDLLNHAKENGKMCYAQPSARCTR
jgi:hypothetical protein